jgi:hypothetical protein
VAEGQRRELVQFKVNDRDQHREISEWIEAWSEVDIIPDILILFGEPLESEDEICKVRPLVNVNA